MALRLSTSHTQLIKNHLLNGGSITALEALRDYGCYRLGARISELRSRGMDIKKKMETGFSKATGRPIHFARYFIDIDNSQQSNNTKTEEL